MSQLKQLPTGWASYELGSLLPLSYGKSLVERERDRNGPIAVYGSSGLVGRHNTPLVDEPTLIIGRKGNVGSVYYSDRPCWVIDTAYFVRGRSRYLCLPLFSFWLKHLRLSELDKSTAVPGLRREDYNAHALPIPPRPEQDRIVAEIEKQFTRLKTAIAALKRVQANLKRYRASVLKAACEGRLVPTEADLARKEHRTYETGEQLLARILRERRAEWEADQLAKMIAAGKPPKDDQWKKKYKEPEPPDIAHLRPLPQGWAWASLSQISQIQGGIQKQPKRAPVRNAYPYLRVANVFRGRLDLSEIEHMELFRDELEKLRLQTGDLLIVEGNGSAGEIGRMAIWRGQIENCVHQNHIIRARPLRGILPDFCAAYWNSAIGSAEVLRVAGSTSGLYTLSVSKVGRLPIPVAPVEEQTRIVTEVERQFSQTDATGLANEQAFVRAAGLRQSILSRAFEGKLVPQDPNDEPAAVLLERIRAERTAQPLGNGSKVARRARARVATLGK